MLPLKALVKKGGYTLNALLIYAKNWLFAEAEKDIHYYITILLFFFTLLEYEITTIITTIEIRLGFIIKDSRNLL